MNRDKEHGIQSEEGGEGCAYACMPAAVAFEQDMTKPTWCSPERQQACHRVTQPAQQRGPSRTHDSLLCVRSRSFFPGPGWSISRAFFRPFRFSRGPLPPLSPRLTRSGSKCRLRDEWWVVSLGVNFFIGGVVNISSKTSYPLHIFAQTKKSRSLGDFRRFLRGV